MGTALGHTEGRELQTTQEVARELARERVRPGARCRFGQREHYVCLRGCAPLGSSVADPERGAGLGPAVPSVVEVGGADIGVDDAFHGDGGEGGVLPDERVDVVASERPAQRAWVGWNRGAFRSRRNEGSCPR